MNEIALITAFILTGALAYVIGSVPFGVLIAKYYRLGDLRAIGSGNIGATNVLRTGNKKAAFLTLLADGLKGLSAVISVSLIMPDMPTMQIVAGVCAMVGHIFPVWLKFHGGKGVASYLGAQFGISPLGGLIACAIWLIGGKISKISSIGALSAALFAAPAQYLLLQDRNAALFSLIGGAILIFTHRVNISRICSGQEGKIKF